METSVRYNSTKTGTRDRLNHHYFGVNLDIVWGIVELELPGVVAELEIISDQGIE